MADNRINVPSGLGGIVRYGEDTGSKFKLKPAHVVAIIIAVVLFVTLLKILFPLNISA